MEHILSRLLPLTFAVTPIMTFWAYSVLSVEVLGQCLQIPEMKTYPLFQKIWIISPSAIHLTHCSAYKLETTDGEITY